ncbi:MAG: PEP-CTERM sorting domain-containing protein [Verrucomicrobiales bacterium]|nr:PEP-CTERM sorting domain-containing protein [Verrucomicrobiales bacterium]
MYYQNTIANPSYDPGCGFALSIEQSAFAKMWVSVSAMTNLATVPTASGVMSGKFNWYSGTLSGQLENYSPQFVISSSASRSAPVVRDGVLLNFSTVTQAPNTDLQPASDSSYVFNGTASAVWEIERTAQITGTGYFGNYNGGVVLKTGAGEAVIGRGIELYNNSGTVRVNAGALTVSGSGENHNGTFTVENSARLNIGGRYELHGANRVTGSGTVSVSGGLVSGAAGDSLNVTGVLMIETSGTLRTTTLSVGSAGRVGVLGSVAANNITADGDFTINSGGVLNIGGLGGGLGVTTLAGALTLSSGALLAFDLGANGLSDQLNLSNGTLLNLSGQSFADFLFNPLTDIFATGGTYTYNLVTGDVNSLSGFTALTGQLNGFDALLSLDEFNSLLQLQIHVIPEPSTWALLLTGAFVLMSGRRRYPGLRGK